VAVSQKEASETGLPNPEGTLCGELLCSNQPSGLFSRVRTFAVGPVILTECNQTAAEEYNLVPTQQVLVRCL
jgi:hypothetical protein